VPTCHHCGGKKGNSWSAPRKKDDIDPRNANGSQEKATWTPSRGKLSRPRGRARRKEADFERRDGVRKGCRKASLRGAKKKKKNENLLSTPVVSGKRSRRLSGAALKDWDKGGNSAGVKTRKEVTGQVLRTELVSSGGTGETCGSKPKKNPAKGGLGKTRRTAESSLVKRIRSRVHVNSPRGEKSSVAPVTKKTPRKSTLPLKARH